MARRFCPSFAVSAAVAREHRLAQLTRIGSFAPVTAAEKILFAAATRPPLARSAICRERERIFPRCSPLLPSAFIFHLTTMGFPRPGDCKFFIPVTAAARRRFTARFTTGLAQRSCDHLRRFARSGRRKSIRRDSRFDISINHDSPRCIEATFVSPLFSPAN